MSTTGWPQGLLQDDDRGLSRWLASRPDARYQLRKNMTQQPEALRLADWLLDWLGHNVEPADLEAACVASAAELRRLYAENESLRADAERYRWLRETRFIWGDFGYIRGVQPTVVGIEFRWFATDSKKPTRDDLDKAITAAKHEEQT